MLEKRTSWAWSVAVLTGATDVRPSFTARGDTGAAIGVHVNYKPSHQ